MRETVKLSTRDEQRVTEAYPAVRRFAFAVADSDVDPDDLLHEALVRVLSRGRIDEIDDLEAYLRRAVANVASNTRRRLGRRRRALGRLRAMSTREVADGPDATMVGSELMRLSAADRAALYLRVVEGRPHGEVAEVMGVSEEAARARVSRALRRMRVEMELEGVES